MIRAKPWNGKDLKGTWEVTIKIDGVRALWSERAQAWMSRAMKPLHNIPPWQPGMGKDCEVYVGSFRDTIRATGSKTVKAEDGCRLKRCKCAEMPDPVTEQAVCKNWEEATPVIKPEHLYSLDPLDERLWFLGEPNCTFHIADAKTIRAALRDVIADGYEGLVLRQGSTWLKVKPLETHDVLVTGAIEGTGRHKGRLGALQTARGDVGTGFSDEERAEFWAMKPIGETIEVSCMSFTPDGKFRHPRFVRLRPDKNAEE